MLLLKLMIVPVLVALMSLAARRFGPMIGGLLIGLPWMTGPIIFFLGQERGDSGTISLAVGAMLATVSISAYALTYGCLGMQFRWPLSLAAGAAAYAIVGWALSAVVLPATPAALIGPVPALPWWDIPVRMLASAVMVTVIALVSDRLGATASGIAASFPVLLTVIGTFTHHQWGSDALLALLRGITRSLLSFVMFFWVVATFVEPLGLVMSYAAATAAALCVSATLIAVNRAAAIKSLPTAAGVVD
jgi:hypothetical protein